MGTFQATTKAAEAPEVDEGMFDGIVVAVANKRVKGGQYTKDTVNGDPKLEWGFMLLDDEGALLAQGDTLSDGSANENAGKPIEVSKLTGVGFNTKATTVPQEIRMLKAVLTKAEYAQFEAGEPTPDSDVAAPEGLLGRKVQLEVIVKENGWPAVGNVVAPRGGQKGTNFDPRASE